MQGAWETAFWPEGRASAGTSAEHTCRCRNSKAGACPEQVRGGGEVKILGREPHHHEDPGFYLEYDWDQHGKGFEQSTARI